MDRRHLTGYVVLLFAYLLLIPGVTEPVLHIVSNLDKEEVYRSIKQSILTSDQMPGYLTAVSRNLLDSIHISGMHPLQDTTKSLLGAAQTLWDHGDYIVGFLIVFFSVFVPVLKGLSLALSIIFQRSSWGVILGKTSGLMGKWSMADVFTMALIVTFLAVNSSSNSSTLIQTQIEFEAGFYYFIGYCLLSILSGQLLSSRYCKDELSGYS